MRVTKLEAACHADLDRQLKALGISGDFRHNEKKIIEAVKEYVHKHKKPAMAVNLYTMLPEIHDSRIRFILSDLCRRGFLTRVRHGMYVVISK